MTVDIEPDPNQECPECGSSNVLPYKPNEDTSTSLSLGLKPLGITRKEAIGRQYLHIEYQCENCGNEFRPQSSGEGPQSKPHIDIDEIISIPTEYGEIKSEVVATDVIIQVEFPDAEYQFTEQVLIDQPIENDEPVMVYGSDGGPIGIAWASTETHSLVTPFPAFPKVKTTDN